MLFQGNATIRWTCTGQIMSNFIGFSNLMFYEERVGFIFNKIIGKSSNFNVVYLLKSENTICTLKCDHKYVIYLWRQMKSQVILLARKRTKTWLLIVSKSPLSPLSCNLTWWGGGSLCLPDISSSLFFSPLSRGWILSQKSTSKKPTLFHQK